MPRRIAAAQPKASPARSASTAPRDALGALLDAAAKLPRGTGPEGSEPLLNPREAARVRAAFQKASPGARAELLSLARDLRGVGQGLFLRAVGARAERLGEASSLETLREFARAVEGLDAATLRERATVLDLDSSRDTNAFDAQTLWEKRGTVAAPKGRPAADDDGLLQRFTSTCGPTVLQMALAEADPVVAFALNASGRASTSSRDAAAGFQRAVLEEFGGVALPRHESALAARLRNALGRLASSGEVSGEQKESLLRYARSAGPLDARARNAVHAVRTRFDGFPSDAELQQLRTALLPARDEGLGTAEFQQAFDKYLRHVTGTQYRMTSPPDGFGRGRAGKHVDAVERALKAGVDVPFGVSEPAHWMLLTAARQGAGGREFLVSDPDGGRTAWVTEKDLVSGAFGDKQFHLNGPGERPYVDCFFLPA
ncbi:MAG: hypothetical protein IT380_17620 [Myxococcales bacterium]|nr:hypothetical protein [Myxococcales bacterium]